jgi:putative tricarboxylic transport membrane protein
MLLMHTKQIRKSVKMAGGSTRGSMDHLIGALAFQSAGANPNDVVYIPYDGGGAALAGLSIW